MKYPIAIFILATSLAFGKEATFQEKIHPLLQKSPTHCLLFTNFDFHPTYVHEQKDANSHSITTLVSYSPDSAGSIAWCHFVTFHLTQNEGDEVSISRIEFRDVRPDAPCFIPKEVVSVDVLGKLTSHTVSVESQPILPITGQLLHQLRNEKKK